MFSILPATLPRSVYANSGVYAAPKRYSRHHTRLPLTSSTSVPTRLPPEVSVMCMKGPSMIRWFPSNVFGRTPRKMWISYKCIVDAIVLPSLSLTRPTGPLPRGHNVETLETPKRCTSRGYHFYSHPTYLRVDARRGPTRIYQGVS